MSIPKVDLTDPARRAEWLAQMAASTAGAIGAGRDATEAYSQRVMSRHEARRHIDEAAGGDRADRLARRNFHSFRKIVDGEPEGMKPPAFSSTGNRKE